jgi:hypothetical protein
MQQLLCKIEQIETMRVRQEQFVIFLLKTDLKMRNGCEFNEVQGLLKTLNSFGAALSRKKDNNLKIKNLLVTNFLLYEGDRAVNGTETIISHTPFGILTYLALHHKMD